MRTDWTRHGKDASWPGSRIGDASRTTRSDNSRNLTAAPTGLPIRVSAQVADVADPIKSERDAKQSVDRISD